MSCSLHDALQLERRGVPVVVVATDAFRRSVAEQLEAISFSAFEPVYIPHPLASLPPDQVHQKADRAVPEIVARLTGASRSGHAPPSVARAPVGADVDCDECAIDAAERGL